MQVLLVTTQMGQQWLSNKSPNYNMVVYGRCFISDSLIYSCRSITEALQRGSLGSQGPSKGSQSWSGVQNREGYLLKLQAARSSLETQEVQQQQQEQKLRDGTGAADSGAVLHEVDVRETK